ncbi:hypothetical protein VitviT2T_005708 [Vitis vinifera]|uniref:beta-galactosidase n=1 Tax=Vitis vinifera TaxID=29760 RepID=A0ABY9BUR5_VITVI|nr:hypothetical protein VitviT2T_005708 [Vitis vinifera]
MFRNTQLDISPYAGSHEKVHQDDHRYDEQGEVNCISRGSHHSSTGTEYLETPHLKGQQKILHSLFISKNGTLANYYMYYSVTNFGRTTSSFATTCYYDEAPLDEYGLPRETKWGHLRDLHAALRLSKKALLWGVTSAQKLGEDLEVKCIMPAGPNLRKAR